MYNGPYATFNVTLENRINRWQFVMINVGKKMNIYIYANKYFQ